MQKKSDFKSVLNENNHAEFISASHLVSNSQSGEILKQVQDDTVFYNGVKAFTLIELLVVVLIIGILSAVALPQYKVAVARSRYKQVVLLGRAFQKAQQEYRLANGTWARSFDELSIDLPAPMSSKTNSNGDNGNIMYFYSWGSCALRFDLTRVDMQCYPKNAPTLEVSLNEQNSMACVCGTGQDYSLCNNICRAETGKTTSTEGSVYNYYYY